MKRYLFSAAAILFLAGFTGLSAEAQVKEEKQSKEKAKSKTLKEYDEIIIKQKGSDKDSKVTIEIKGGEVLVNGKPLDEFEDNNISVQKRAATRLRATVARSPFRGQGGAWSFEGEERAFLGVSSEATDGEGARIVKVTENEAAAKAGLKEGDIIVTVNDTKIESPADLSEAISTKKPDDKVTITYKRNGKKEKVTATLGKREVTGFSGLNIAPGVEGFENLQNFRFENFESLPNFENHGLGNTFLFNGTPRIGIRAQDTEDGKGVKVLGIDKNSAADKAGLKENDIITEFEGKSVNSADDLVKASRESKDKSELKVKYNRDGSSRTTEIKIPKKLKTANL